MNNHDRNMMQLWPHAVRRPIESNVKKNFFFPYYTRIPLN